MEILLDPRVWASLLTLTVLEIILGIDNLSFISLVSNRLPVSQQGRARRTGLALAVITRLLLLAGMALTADGIGFHIPRGYLYAAIAFSAFVEFLNLRAAKRRRKEASLPVQAEH